MSRQMTLKADRVLRIDRTGDSAGTTVDQPAFVDVTSSRAIYRDDAVVVVEMSFATFRFEMPNETDARDGVRMLATVANR